MNRTKFSNPTSANPGVGNPMTPSPSSENLKGGVRTGDTPNTTRPDSNKGTGDIQDHVKGDLVGTERKR